MFTGQFAGEIGRWGNMPLPEKHIAVLREEEHEPRSMFLVAGETLAIYSDKAFGRLVFGLADSLLKGEDPIEPVRHLVSIHEQVKSKAGKIKIPRKFKEIYGFEAGMEVCFVGCGEYVEVWERREWERRSRGGL
ncbi:hypothetical protein LJC56_10520 [Christensenellaceae bacterium OttesenSCG-928-K19]|nr:hypothetical protein [Christensenellaceae bacterium OttesenSCG-928-K19]